MNWTPEELEEKLNANPDLRLALTSRTVVTGAVAQKEATFPPNPITLSGKEKQGLKNGASKYHVAPKEDRTYNGIVYHSKAEMTYYRDVLEPQLLAGELTHVLRQVPFVVGNDPLTVYVADFVTLEHFTVLAVDGWQIRVIEKKGMMKPEDTRKLNLFRKKYPNIRLEVV